VKARNSCHAATSARKKAAYGTPAARKPQDDADSARVTTPWIREGPGYVPVCGLFRKNRSPSSYLPK